MAARPRLLPCTSQHSPALPSNWPPTLTGQGRRPATQPIIAAAWRRVLTDEPGLFAAVAEHPATIRALVAAHRELRDLTDDGRKRLGRSTRLAADVVRLHEAVCSATSDRWYDATDLLSTAAGLATTSAAAESGRLVLYLPQSLTRAEATFGRALADNADFAVVVGLTGVMRADRAVHRSLDRLGLDPLDDPESTRPTATQVLHASDSDDEVRCVVRDVVQTLRTTPAHRIAVLYGRGTPYARLLHEHLAVSGITVNGVGTRAVHERAVARTVLGVLALAGAPDDHHLNRDVRRGDLFRTLAESPTRDVAGDLIPTSRWERISRTANVVAGDDWSRRLDAYIVDQQTIHDRESQVDDPRPGVLDRAQRTIEAATALRAFATALRDTLKQGHTLTTWSELSTWALDLSHRLLGSERQLARLPLEEQSAAAAVEQALTGLTSLDALEQRADLPTLRDVLAVQLEASLPRVGRFGDGVFVAPLSASVGLDVDVVYVVGLAEDIVPDASTRTPYCRSTPATPPAVSWQPSATGSTTAIASCSQHSQQARTEWSRRSRAATFAAARSGSPAAGSSPPSASCQATTSSPPPDGPTSATPHGWSARSPTPARCRRSTIPPASRSGGYAPPARVTRSTTRLSTQRP